MKLIVVLWDVGWGCVGVVVGGVWMMVMSFFWGGVFGDYGCGVVGSIIFWCCLYFYCGVI